MTIDLAHADMLEWLADYRGPLFDSVCCDPPYHLTSIVKRFGGANAAEAKDRDGLYQRASRGFMGKQWDGGDIAFDPETWAGVLRVLKPGSFLAAFGGTRTFHRLVCAIEDAGFEIRDTLSWNYGSGFPKSHNISKALADLPSCSCNVASDGLAVIDSVPPPSPLGARVGTERVSVLPAGGAADTAGGLGLQSLTEAGGREPVVQGRVEALGGHLYPVVFGSLDVARVAEGEQVALGVGGGEVDPKALRDKMVDDQSIGRAAVRAATVPGNDGSGNAGPSAALVSPSLPAPSGVAASLHPTGIVGAHTGAGAVGPGPTASETIGLEVGGAGSASENRHIAERSTTGFKCKACGGVIRDRIPQGLGTALKPAMELICLARKPLSEKSIAANVLKHGTGALNIDATRVGDDTVGWGGARGGSDDPSQSNGRNYRLNGGEARPVSGRWPANVIHDGSDEVIDRFPASTTGVCPADGIGGYGGGLKRRDMRRAENGGDSGSAARFFYSAKAGPLDRLGSAHATVKPVDLMRWLVRLVTPPGGRVLDPFAGSGTTGIACMAEGFDCQMIELEAEHVTDIQRKLDYLLGNGGLSVIEKHKAKRDREAAGGSLDDAGPLFGSAAA